MASTGSLTVFEALEDFDNSELDEFENREQMEEAVKDYNSNYCTCYDPKRTVIQYEAMKREKRNSEPTE